MNYFLTSARLGFRCWSSDDLPLANALWGDARVSALVGGPFRLEQVERRLQREQERMRTHQVQYWPIFHLSSGDHAGCAGLSPRRGGGAGLRARISSPAGIWGLRLAEEAARAVITFAFDALEAEALFAGHHPENHASRHILQKLGFAYTHQELYPPTGLMHPSYVLKRAAQ